MEHSGTIKCLGVTGKRKKMPLLLRLLRIYLWPLLFQLYLSRALIILPTHLPERTRPGKQDRDWEILAGKALVLSNGKAGL